MSTITRKSAGNPGRTPLRGAGKGGSVVDTFARTPFTADKPGENQFQDGIPATLVYDPGSLPDVSKEGCFVPYSQVDPLGLLPWNREK